MDVVRYYMGAGVLVLLIAFAAWQIVALTIELIEFAKEVRRRPEDL